MNTKAEAGIGAVDKVKLLLAAALVVGGLVGYYYFVDQSVLIRFGIVLVAIAMGLAVLFQSNPGKDLWRFIVGSRIEIRKVFWPTRQEAMQTTIAVIIFAMLMGVFFWLLDMVLAWIARSAQGF